MQLVRYRFSVDEYEQLIAAGVLAEDLRIELIDGEIVELAPTGDSHVSGLNLLVDDMYAQVREEAVISVQNPFASRPMANHSQTSRSSGAQRCDFLASRRSKTSCSSLRLPIPRLILTGQSLYAAAGIQEAWLVDMKAQVIERHTNPARWQLPPGCCGAP